MSIIHKISIKYKIILIILITNIILISLGFVLEIYYSRKSLTTRYVEDIGFYSKKIGEQCASSLDFDYSNDAKRFLKSFEKVKTVQQAYIFNSQKKLFAQYDADSLNLKKKTVPNLHTIKKNYKFVGDTLYFVEEIVYEGEFVGNILVLADTKISQEMKERYFILGFVSLALTLFAYLLANYMQGFISKPIIKLSETVNKISEKKDYSIRITNDYSDEIGVLNTKINNFLEVIQNREIERDKAEFALRESEDRFRSLAELLPETVFEVDSFLDFLFINKSASVTFGYSELEMNNLNFNNIIISTEHEKLHSVIRKLINSQTSIQDEFIAVRKNGEQFPVLLYVSPLFRNGLPKGFRGILIDFSELKKAQNEITQLNKDLEKRVKERTLKLAKANKELSEVSYVSAHDLKTPIRGITQLATWILNDYKTELNAEVIQNLEMLLNRASHMNKLVNGILEYISTNTSGKNMSKFTLNEVINILKQEKIKQPNVIFELQGEHEILYYEKNHLIQIFGHLIDNSIKFNNNEVIKIAIKVSTNELDREFTISDNGIGIDPKYHKKVLGVFKTLSSEYSNQNVGIGLALVKKIIDLYNGKISIHSEGESKGTTIIFNLKVIQSDNE